jgi:ParB/RepB/Spo0J family partition protein
VLTKKVRSIPLDSITIARDERQRREIDVSDIIESIRKRGVLTPICVREDGRLIFGERRLTAAKQLGHKDILARIAPNDLSELNLQLLELDENVMRKDLPWQEKAAALRKMREIFLLEHPGSSQELFADSVAYSRPFVSRMLEAAEEIAKGNERVAQAPALNKAVNVIQRAKAREENNALSDIIDSVGVGTAPPELEHPEEPILLESFHSWAPLYCGPKFNLIHCDFPYGINLDDSDQLQVLGTAHQTYDDSERVFWDLLETFAQHRDKFISHSAHLIFWHSMKEDLYLPMRKFFSERLPEFTFDDYPLVWLKSDNRGIAPDVERRPRRIYETALFGWRGERKLVKLGSNAYAAPKENGAHPSAKPEPVLRHFFSMVCDKHTRAFDPTCGSGSSLRAAESLGAGSVLGLELDPTFHKDAVARLRQARSLAKLSESIA